MTIFGANEIADRRRQGGRRTFRTDVQRARGARLDRRGDGRRKENGRDCLAGQSGRRRHDADDPDVSRDGVAEGCRHTQAAADRQRIARFW